jgi:hypothetical protein
MNVPSFFEARPLLVPHAWPDPSVCSREMALAALQAMPEVRAALRDADASFTAHEPDALNTAFERAWAACTWPEQVFEDGAIPLAAQSSGGAANCEAQAWITFCNWDVGSEGARLSILDSLSFSEQETEEILRQWVDLASNDGLKVVSKAVKPDFTWLVQAPWLAELRQASWDRVSTPGVRVNEWLGPLSNDATKRLRRLQNEFQMLMYTHALNDARAELGEPAVNSFWLHGAGALPQHANAWDCDIDARLHTAASSRGPWTEAWQALAEDVRERLSRNGEVRICGEQGWITLRTAPKDALSKLKRRISSAFSPLPWINKISLL